MYDVHSDCFTVKPYQIGFTNESLAITVCKLSGREKIEKIARHLAE